MKTKLKTLKDLETVNGFVSFNKVRAEAIKWVKANEEASIKNVTQPDFTNPNWLDINTWIKYFFNITEEDLK